MIRTFALIRGGSVINHIVADDSYIDYVKSQYDEIVETTDIAAKPSVGDYYVDEEFVQSKINVIYGEEVLEEITADSE
jgi:hypothetical protein